MRRLFTWLLIAVLLIGGMPEIEASAATVVQSGTCGENLTWTLDDEGTLTISGSGAMEDYKNYGPWNSDAVRSLYVEEGVTSIGEYSFKGCSRLSSISMPESLTGIGGDAFSDCSSLRSVVIPNGVKRIGAQAFSGCGKISDITITEGVTEFGVGAFQYCSSLVDIKLPNSIKKIDGHAFRNCNSITDISIPESVTYIGNNPFSGCSSLRNIDVSEHNESYCSVNGVLYSFDKKEIICYAAGRTETEYSIPNSVVKIGYEAFEGCSNLSKINIPNSVVQIENNAFEHCSNLKSINIPETVTSIGSDAFRLCSSLGDIDVAEGNANYKSIDGILYDKKMQTLIRYWEGKKETKFNIPESVLKIKSYAFENCSNLVKINIPEGTEEIGYAFVGCIGLSNIIIPKSVTKIESGAFWDHSSSLIIFGEKNSYAETYANNQNIRFKEISELDTGNLMDSGTCGDNLIWKLDDEGTLTISGSGKMDNYSSSAKQPLWGACQNLCVEDGVTSIGSYAFSYCKNLKNIRLVGSISSIGLYAFDNCDKLKNVSIPEGVKSIDQLTFYDCENLSVVSIPDSVTYIGYFPFAWCYSLKNIEVSHGNEKYQSVDGVLYDKGFHTLIRYAAGKEETEFNVLDGVTQIGDKAFHNCRNLKSVKIPKSVTSIKSEAFRYCSNLSSIIIPRSVTTIGKNAFEYCPPSLTIYGARGSYAETYAAENNINFIEHSHTYGTDWETDEADHWRECDCGAKKDETAHTEDAGTVTKEPTGTETGLRTYKCSVCGYVTRTEEIAMLKPSHTHVYGTNWKSDLTSHWKECSCGEKIENATHTEDNGTVTKEPTETETGLRIYKCVVCGRATRPEQIAVLPPSHTHTYGTDWKSNATTHWKECFCGENKENAAHTEDNGIITKEPTETETGLKTYKCAVCGYVIRTEEIAKLLPPHIHTYGTDWKSNATTHWKECSCGENKENAAHTEDNGIITKEPTETETGLKTYKCVVCGYVIRTEEVEKHGEGLYDKGNETTTEVETPPEGADIPEDDRIMSITINPAFNMKHKNGSDVEIDLSKIKIKAKEIYDEAGLKRAEAALGETLNGNKHYNLLDLTLLYNGEDFSNGYDGLVKVIIPLPKGHRDKTFSCYRLTETEGKVTKELIPGEQTEDSYIIYLEHFSEYALVATGLKESHTHVYSEDWKSDATGHWKECECKDKAEESVHTQDEGTVTKEATKIETGIKTYKCGVCGYVIKTEEIAKLPANEETANKESFVAAKVTKEQKKKNEIEINKKVSFKITNNFLTVAWNNLSGADGYDIYAASCDDDFKGITASVGKNKTSVIIRKINGRKINGKKTYKVKVKAYHLLSNGKKQYIGTSADMHATGNMNKTMTNAKSIRLKKKTFVLKKGKSVKIHAAIIKADRKKKLLSKTHGAKLSYVSTDETIATVTATGKIKAKKRGKCIIYVRALNGISKKIKVTVK